MYIENNITRFLDELLKASENKPNDHHIWDRILMLPGFGVTSSIKGWLEHNNLKHFYISAASRGVAKLKVECFPPLSLNSVRVVNSEELERVFTPVEKEVNVIFTTEEIDSIDENTIIIIDDYARACEETRKELFNLIAYGHVIDIRYNESDCKRQIKPKFIVVVLDEILADKLSAKEKKLFDI